MIDTSPTQVWAASVMPFALAGSWGKLSGGSLLAETSARTWLKHLMPGLPLAAYQHTEGRKPAGL